MRRFFVPLAVAAAVAFPASAGAALPHTVQPGETLWSIAAANNLYTSALAAYNGLSEDSQVILGSTIMVPTSDEALVAVNNAIAAGTLSPYAATDDENEPEAAAPATTTTEAAPEAMGAYTVRPGDTLSGLAAIAGVPLDQMAAMNGIDPDGLLVSGTVIKLPTGSPTPPRADEPAPEPVLPEAVPSPTDEQLDSGTVSSIAAEHGVPGSLAAAVAYQESGFNNSMVSGANARGVMQILPGTWTWVQDNLAERSLDPALATDNVAAGSLYLRSLLDQTGGDEETAIAGYYQGLASVQRDGMLPETQQYVANVQALRQRFGG
jgi:soluble lytic murein transglycosylase-like protein